MTEHPGGPVHQHPQGTIRLTIQGNALTTSMITPTVFVSGHRVLSRFGTMDIPVWAGPNTVDIHSTWLRQYGQASLSVHVGPGDVVPVFYAMPWHQFTKGAIGHRKQRRPGAVAMFTLLTVFMIVPLAVILSL